MALLLELVEMLLCQIAIVDQFGIFSFARRHTFYARLVCTRLGSDCVEFFLKLL